MQLWTLALFCLQRAACSTPCSMCIQYTRTYRVLQQSKRGGNKRREEKRREGERERERERRREREREGEREKVCLRVCVRACVCVQLRNKVARRALGSSRFWFEVFHVEVLKHVLLARHGQRLSHGPFLTHWSENRRVKQRKEGRKEGREEGEGVCAC